MDKIDKILMEVLHVSKDEVNKDLGMNDVSTWDSLSHMNLIVAIESNLGIELSGDDIADMITFDSVRSIISKYC